MRRLQLSLDVVPRAALVVALTSGAVAHAATIQVTGLTDVVANNGTCSLREAVRAANLNTASGAMAGECPAGQSGATDVIVLGAGNHTLTIAGSGEDAAATGDLDIVNNAADPDLILTGSATTVIAQNAIPDDRVLHVLGGANVEVSGGVTLRGGSAATGGGMLVDSAASLTLTGVVVTFNSATSQGGGLANLGGSVLIRDNSRITGNTASGAGIPVGGGIASSGSLTVSASTVSNNTASERGGGLHTTGTTFIIDGSTFSGNQARFGAGIYTEGGPLTVDQSTLGPNNAAGMYGGGIVAFSPVTVTASRFLANTAAQEGGGVFNNVFATDNVTVSGSCISGNSNSALFNNIGLWQSARDNWWGADSGPGPANGGDTTNAFWNTFPFLVDPPIAGCGQLLTVAGAGPAEGSVAPSTPGVAMVCSSSAGVPSGDCTSTIRTGRTVDLVATPGSGSAFAGWAGCDTVAGATCTVTMGAPRTVTAIFNVACYTLTTIAAPAAGGSVMATPAQNCSGGYNPGTALTLTATAATPYTFVGWSGDLAGATNPGNLAMDGDKTVTARFTENFELIHGAQQRHDLREQSGVPDEDWYRVHQSPYSSYEIVVDEASGDVGPALSLERIDGSGAVIQTSTPVSALDLTQSLRWARLSSGSAADEKVRVRSALCAVTPCGADDTYRIRAYETTYSIVRFNNGGSQLTVLVLQNPSSGPVAGEAHFWDSAGTLVATLPFTLGPKETLVRNTGTVTGASGVSGSITVAHDARYGELAGKTVTLELSTGFSFDSPMSPRVR